MTTTDLIDRLGSDDAMDAPLFREVARACGLTLDPDDDRLARLMEMILVGAWRDACAELQKVLLPGLQIRITETVGEECEVVLVEANGRWANGWFGIHPTSECRAHLVAIWRAREAQGHG